LRTVISIADLMPEPGKRFYEAGPAYGIARVARYLEDQVAAACWQSKIASFPRRSTTFKPLMFNAAGPPTEKRMDYVVRRAVKTFLAAYRR
jgi:AefR-like transcriptional repressor, C-terminal domain